MSVLSRPLVVLSPLAAVALLMPGQVAAQTAPGGNPLVISDSGSPAGAPGDTPGPVSNAPVIAPLKLDIARRDLKNFLTDAEALTPYRRADGTSTSLQEVFVIGANAVPRAIFWDPLACRLLGVLDLEAPAPPVSATPASPAPADAESGKEEEKSDDNVPPPAPSPYLLTAAGAHPLTGPGGANGAPRYFGFRLVGGMPEFLYTIGALAVEERLWIEDGGKILKQRFSVRESSRGIQLTFPAEWRAQVEATVGTWKKNVLTVPKESSGEVILTYRLTAPAPEPAESN